MSEQELAALGSSALDAIQEIADAEDTSIQGRLDELNSVKGILLDAISDLNRAATK